MTIFKIGKGGALHVDVEEFPAAQSISVPNVVGDEDATLLVLPPASGVASAVDIQAQIDAAGSTPTSIQVAAGTYGVLHIGADQDIALVGPVRGAVTIGNPTIADGGTLRLVNMVAGDLLVTGEVEVSLYLDNSVIASLDATDEDVISVDVTMANGSICTNDLTARQPGSTFILRDSAVGGGLSGGDITMTNSSSSANVDSSGDSITTVGSVIQGSLEFQEEEGVWTTDGYSLSRVMTIGGNITNGVIALADSGKSVVNNAVANNVSETSICALAPGAGLYRIDARILVATTGTTGTAAVNVVFTDEAGEVTVAIPSCTAVITGLNRGAGSYVFYHTGPAAQIKYSVTGVVTPGTLAAKVRLNLTKL